MPETNHEKLHGFFTGSFYKIPKYQRGYAWKERHINDLISDIKYLYNSDAGISHYFGTIVLYRDNNDKKTYYIIDGQQRLITISLLVSALDEKLSQIKDNTNSPEMAEKIKDFRNRKYEDFVRRNRDRISPDEHKLELYKEAIDRRKNLVGDSELNSPSERNIKQNLEILYDWLDSKEKN